MTQWRFEPMDRIRYDGIPMFTGTIIERVSDYEGHVNDLVDDETKIGPAYAILTDNDNQNGEPIVTFVWEDDACLVSER